MLNHLITKSTVILFTLVALYRPSEAMAQCYAISGTETVYDQSTNTITNTLNTCKSYRFVWSLTHNSTGSVSEDITITLPLGTNYDQIINSSGATVMYQTGSGTTSPVFDVSGWLMGTTLELEIEVTTPSCVINPSLSNLTEIEGETTCSVFSLANSLAIASPTMLVSNFFGSGTILKNTGDVSELIFKIKNVSTNGSTIEQVSVAPVADFSIDFLGDYYLSTNASIPSGTNYYSYAYPAATAGVTTLHQPISTTITIGSADWLDLFSVPSLAQGEELYLHIPYITRRCGSVPGSYQFNMICGTDVCSSQSVASNISLVNGDPNINVYANGATEQGTFCPASPSDVDAQFEFKFKNLGTPVSGAPAGNAKAIDLKFYLYGLDSYGLNDDDNFTLFNGATTFVIPNTSPYIASSQVTYGGRLYNVYEFDLSALPVSLFSNNPYPFGPNSLGDIDGDGFVDDLAEGSEFSIRSFYKYNIGCPLQSTCTNQYDVLNTIQLKYNDQCESMLSTDLRQIPFDINNGNTGNSQGYNMGSYGGGGSMVVPPDILEGTDDWFSATICTNPTYERFGPSGFDFDCPNGYHEMRIELPAGYHLYNAGMTQISPAVTGVSAGEFEFEEIEVVGRCGGTQLITPIIEEHCGSGGSNFITLNFGHIPASDCGPYMETYMLPCLNIPMYMDCSGTGAPCGSVPENFGFDDLSFALTYVCDETCNTCTSNLVCNGTSTYHHCDGECDSYFSTENDFEFVRTLLGHNNSNPVYDCTSTFDPLTTTTGLELDAAYPGDNIHLSVSGSFIGNPTGEPLLTGANFASMQLQLRHEALGTASGDFRLFDLKTTSGGILITNTSTSATSFVPSSDLIYNTVLNTTTNTVEMNFELPNTPAGLGFISLNNVSYAFDADLDLIVRTSPAVNASGSFLAPGIHPLVSLRTEFMGVENSTATEGKIDYSCDSWGNHFKLLQPGLHVGYYPGPYGGFNQTSTCEPYKFNVMFNEAQAEFNINQDDFMYEFKEYANLDPEITIKIPPGYHYVSSTYYVAHTPFPSNGIPNTTIGAQQYINGFPVQPYPSGYPGPTFVPYPISGEVVSGSLASGFTIDYDGLTGSGSCWPLMDQDFFAWHNAGYIEVTVQATCDAPLLDYIEIDGSYSQGIQQPDPSYHVQTPFHYDDLVIKHRNPEMTVNSPAATFNAYSNQISFDFEVCNTSVASINDGWVAFETGLNTVDLANATVYALPGMAPVTINTYLDGAGNTAILAHLGDQAVSSCKTYRIVCNINTNGCVASGEDPVLDFLNIIYGAQCDGSAITEPNDVCEQGERVFNFLRYPSDVELLLPVDAYPSGSQELCNGELEYHFIINSFEIGAVDDLNFWTEIPAGLQFEEITFTHLNSSPLATYTYPAPEANTYGPGNDLPGWSPLDELGLQYLPGTLSGNLNQIDVVVKLSSTCDYNLEDPVNFYFNGRNSCGQTTDTDEATSTPQFVNTTLPSELVLSSEIEISDSEPLISCDNSALVTVTIDNTSSATNISDLMLVVTVPGAPFVIDPGTGVLSGNQITWTIPAGTIQGGLSVSETYTVSLPLGILCEDDIPMTASIEFSQDVACTATGGSCNVQLTTEPITFTVDACCNCTLVVETSSEPVYCKGHLGSATATATGGVGTLTYVWDDPMNQTTATATNLTQGTYTVTVTDENGCSETVTVTVGAVNSPLTIVATPDNSTICEGETVTITLSGGNTYNYWDGTNSVSSSGAPFEVNPTSTTTYNIYGYDEFGCSGNTTVEITVEPLVTPTFTAVGPYCSGTSISALTTTSNEGIEGSWSPAINNTATTTYTFTPDAGQCATGTTLTITIIPTNTIETGINQTTCINSAITNITLATTGATGATFSGLPTGVTGSWAGNVVTISGTPTVSGTFNYTVTTTGGCPAATATGTITVNPTNTITFTSAVGTNEQHICVNSLLTDITYSTTGATGATFSGLPTGVTGSWSGNVVTISGTPTVSGTFNYTVTTTGGCPPAIATGTIVVNATNTISLISGPTTQSLCMNTAITTITYATTGATGATFSGLPAGVTGSWSGNVVTISGTPTVSGTFNYTVTTTGGCPPATADGLLRIAPINTIEAGTNQTVCINSAMTNITLATTGASGVSFSGLPAGVTGSWASGVATISGTPTVSGTFNYTVTTTGGCPVATTGGTITVNPANTISLTSSDGSAVQTICFGASITNITYSTTGATGATFSGLPAGVTGSWAGNVVTISGTPTVSGTFNYTVTTTGGCSPATAYGYITVNPIPSMTAPTNISVCPGAAVNASFSSSPSGATFGWTNNNSGIGIGGSGSGNISYTAPANNTSSSIVGTITVTPSIGGCSGSPVQFTITIKPKPSMTAPASISVCPGAAVNASFTSSVSGATFGWTNTNNAIGLAASGSGNISYTAPANNTGSPFVGTISVTPTAASCVGSAVTFTITIKPKYTIAAGTVTNPSKCSLNNGSIQVTGPTSIPGTVTWSGTSSGSSTISTLPYVISGLGAGSYSIQFTPTGGCPTNTLSVTLTPPASPPIPTITGITSLCGGASTTLYANPSTGGYTYLWSPGGATTTSLNVTTAGNYTVTITNANNCSSTSAATTVSVQPNPTVSINGLTEACPGVYVTLTATNPPGTYSWSPSGATTQGIVVLTPSSGSAVNTLTYTDNNGCQGTATHTLTKKICKTVIGCNIVSTFTISGSGCNRGATNTSTAGGSALTSSTPGYNYLWQVFSSNGSLIYNGTGFNLPSTAFPGTSSPQTYTICLKVSSNSAPNCYDETCTQVTISCYLGLPVVSANTQGLNGIFELKDQDYQSYDGREYSWDFGDGTTSTEANPNHKYAHSGIYEVCVRLDGDNNKTVCRTIQVSADETELASAPMLSVNPNPTTERTNILVEGVEGKTVEIELYSMLGEKVAVLYSKAESKEPIIRLVWNAANVTPGVYLIKANVGNKTIMEKVVVSH